MNSFSIYKAIYFIGIVFIFFGGYRLFKHLSYGDVLFAAGVLFYSGIQIKFLFFNSIKEWWIFEYLKLSVNILFLISIVLLLAVNLEIWYYPFILGLLLDFFTNIFKRIKKTND